MMARLGFIFQSVSIVVVVLAALACASGDTKNKTDASTAGTNAMTGGGGGQSGSSTVPPTTNTGSGGSQGGEVLTTGGTDEPPPVGPECSNNIAEEGEMCDGTDLAGASCESLMPGYTGTITCMADCQNYDTSMCFEEEPGEDASVVTGDAGGYGG